jgi:hypothetical protein
MRGNAVLGELVRHLVVIDSNGARSRGVWNGSVATRASHLTEDVIEKET